MPEPVSIVPAPTQTVTASQPLPGAYHTVPSFDVTELLPERCADLLRALRQRAADAHAVIPEFETVRQASMDRINAENALRRLTDHPQDFGHNLKPDNPTVIAAQRTLGKLTADFERLKQLQEVRAAAWQTASGALAAVESWLKDGRPGSTVLEAVEVEPPKLAKGEDVLSGVERLRRRGRELKADLARISAAPFPSSYAKAQMRRQIDALAMQRCA